MNKVVASDFNKSFHSKDKKIYFCWAQSESWDLQVSKRWHVSRPSWVPPDDQTDARLYRAVDRWRRVSQQLAPAQVKYDVTVSLPGRINIYVLDDNCNLSNTLRLQVINLCAVINH